LGTGPPIPDEPRIPFVVVDYVYFSELPKPVAYVLIIVELDDQFSQQRGVFYFCSQGASSES
jgi:hypothetical protein